MLERIITFKSIGNCMATSLTAGIALIIIGAILFFIPRIISIPIPIRIIAIIASALLAIGIILIGLSISKIVI